MKCSILSGWCSVRHVNHQKKFHRSSSIIQIVFHWSSCLPLKTIRSSSIAQVIFHWSSFGYLHLVLGQIGQLGRVKIFPNPIFLPTHNFSRAKLFSQCKHFLQPKFFSQPKIFFRPKFTSQARILSMTQKFHPQPKFEPKPKISPLTQNLSFLESEIISNPSWLTHRVPLYWYPYLFIK